MNPIDVMKMGSAAGGGGGGLAAVVPAGFYYATRPSGTVTNNMTFQVAGGWIATDDNASTGTWKTGGGVGADYAIRWTTASGSLTNGTSGTWYNLGSPVVFGVSTSVGSKVCGGTVEIRRASDSVVIATGSIELTASIEL